MLKGEIQVEGNTLFTSDGQTITLPDDFPLPDKLEESFEFHHPGYWSRMILVGNPW